MIELSKDPIANYVVGKAIEVSEGEQKEKFCELISSNRSELVSIGRSVLSPLHSISRFISSHCSIGLLFSSSTVQLSLCKIRSSAY